MAALMCAPGHVQAEEIPSASKTVYDFSGWSNRGMLELFAKAADEGRQFPTKEEFEEAVQEGRQEEYARPLQSYH